MAKSKLVKANQKIAKEVVGGCKKIETGVVDGYKRIETGAVGSYKKIETAAVGGFNKIADKFVDLYLTKEGESVEEARTRLTEEQNNRKASGKAGNR